MPVPQQRGQLTVGVGGVGFVAGDHLDLAAAQAGGDLQRGEFRDALFGLAQGFGQTGLRQPEHSDGVLAIDSSPGDGVLHVGCLHRGLPHRLQFARRTRQHDDGRLAGNDHPGGGSDRIHHHRSDRDHGLLAVGGPDRVEVAGTDAGHQLLQDVGDLVLQLDIQRQLAAAEPGDGGDGHVVGGRSQAAAGDDQVHTLVGHEAQLRLDVGGAVAADGDVSELDAQLEKAVGEPRSVGVGNPSGQNFGSGDDNARACTHGYDIRRADRTAWTGAARPTRSCWSSRR